MKERKKASEVTLQENSRVSYDVFKDILQVLADHGTVTRGTKIMYRANLSWDMLQKYMKIMVDSEFVTTKPIDRYGDGYMIADKGRDYLTKYSSMRALFA